MEITFEKVGNKYVAEFEATADFNLHIERAEQATLEVYQRGIAEGEYDFAWSAGIGARKVIDYDFAALVYPKWIKVVSGSEVLSASVNFNEGGGSGSGSGSGSDDIIKWEYYRIIGDYNTSEFIHYAVTYCEYIHYTDNNSTFITSDSNNLRGITKIACTNIPLIYISNDSELIFDKGSWKLNFCESEGIDEEAFNSVFSPITKDEFFTLEPMSV